MIRGTIYANGVPWTAADQGYSVKKVTGGPGLYDIFFKPAFPSMPAASATQIWRNPGVAGWDAAVIAHLGEDRMRVFTGSGGGARDAEFSFIVIGPR
jgi:hypothetical protein